MSDQLSAEIRVLLEQHEREGGPSFDGLVSQLYADLRRVARGQIRRGPQPRNVGTTSLVHEAYLKLADHADESPHDPSHFLALAAKTMRHIVIDHARRRSRHKRGGGQADLPLHDEQIAAGSSAARFLELDQALERLERVDSRLVQVIDCRFFAGLSEKETAAALGVTERTIQRDWHRAREWLRKILGS
jgi:RNA polymerase sigma factor (TIGR02999 family)